MLSKKINVIKHNCCKEGKFEFKEIALTEDSVDIIKCKICGRLWEEVK